MEQAQRDRVKEAGGKVDKVKFRKIFLQVVSDFRGKKLAPFPARSCPYPEEWQQMVRIAAMPKTLIDYLRANEQLISERRLLLPDIEAKSFFDVLQEWAAGDQRKAEYTACLVKLFQDYFVKLLVYRFELPSVAKRIASGTRDGEALYAKLFPSEFGLRLLNILPELLTAATLGQLTKPADSPTISSMVEFINSHQAFMAHLEQHMETLLSSPSRKAVCDEPMPESYGIDFFERREIDVATDCPLQELATDAVLRKRTGKRHKRKNLYPTQKLPPAQLVSQSI